MIVLEQRDGDAEIVSGEMGCRRGMYYYVFLLVYILAACGKEA